MLIDHYFSGGDFGKYGSPAIPKNKRPSRGVASFYALRADMAMEASGRLGQGYLVILFYPQL
ncbi:MAG: hypothetical protein ACRCWT_09420, partial [Aeromonas veronii]